MPFGIMCRNLTTTTHQPANFNVTIPFERPLCHGFQQPWRIRIVAIPKAEKERPRRFCVNLKNAEGEIVLHFNPRWDEKAIVLNCTRDGGKWQSEERCSTDGLPFQPGEPFTLDMVAGEGKVEFSVNGVFLCEFLHRGDFSTVNTLEIDGDLAAIPLVEVEKQQQQ